ncbi:MAG TPA: cytochrome c [Candidatus Aquilonibacter sp.]|nr:cytochrome c [Candidatus Aquilonibacter sp.]
MNRAFPLWAVVALAAVTISGCAPAVSAKTDTTAGTSTTLGGDAHRGEQIFHQNCSTCHGPTGAEGGAVGPSLRNENMRMDFGATDSWIKDPQPPMPKLYPQFLSDRQVRDLAAYVQSL